MQGTDVWPVGSVQLQQMDVEPLLQQVPGGLQTWAKLPPAQQ